MDELSTKDMRSLAALTSYGNIRYMKDAKVVSEYGATPEILAILWKILCARLTTDSKPYHM